MCQYCEFNDYTGENLPVEVKVDGRKDNHEVYLLDDIESGNPCLVVNSTFTELRIEINYCPICGKRTS